MPDMHTVDLPDEHKPLSENGQTAARIATNAIMSGAGDHNRLIGAAVLALLDLSDAIRNIE